MTKLRQFAGAVGLLLVAIAGPLTLLAILTDRSAVPGLLAIAVLGLLLWAQAVAAQARLDIRIAVAWLIVLMGLVVGWLVAVLVAYAILVALGVDETLGIPARVVLIGIGATVTGWWVRRNPRRSMFLQALRRASLGRATEEDTRLLREGPRGIVRRESTA